MNIQTPASRNTDPETSHMAVDLINRTGSRKTDQQKVFDYVVRAQYCAAYPLTGAEIARGLQEKYPLEDWPREKAMKRLGDLKGIKVEHSDRRACNALKNASVCVTWRLVSAGSGA